MPQSCRLWCTQSSRGFHWCQLIYVQDVMKWIISSRLLPPEQTLLVQFPFHFHDGACWKEATFRGWRLQFVGRPDVAGVAVATWCHIQVSLVVICYVFRDKHNAGWLSGWRSSHLNSINIGKGRLSYWLSRFSFPADTCTVRPLRSAAVLIQLQGFKFSQQQSFSPSSERCLSWTAVSRLFLTCWICLIFMLLILVFHGG